MALDLTPDELLSTTRAVRKRLDLTRPVPRGVLEECLRLAQQAPTASYSQNWHFVVVTDAEKRAALGEIWREVAYPYLQRGGGPREGQMSRIGDAVVHLAEHIHEVPVHVIPCVLGRYEGQSNPIVAAVAVLASYAISWLLTRRASDEYGRHYVRRAVHFLTFLVALVAIGFVWNVFSARAGLGFGFFAAGLAFALQEVIGAVAGWF